MFTLKELRVLADIIDKTPFQGTIHTLPPALQEVTFIRMKIQDAINRKVKETNENKDAATVEANQGKGPGPDGSVDSPVSTATPAVP